MADQAPVRRFAPTPVETTVKSNRKFVIEPVETSSGSNKATTEPAAERTENTASPPKPKKPRLAPEPVETSSRSNKVTTASTESTASPPESKKPRFTPEPLEEVSVRSNRSYVANFEVPSKLQTALQTPPSTASSSSSADGAPQPSSSSAARAPQPRPRFKPQLIETVKRIKRAGDSVPATLPTDKTDITPGTKHIYLPKQKLGKRPLIYPTPPDNTPNASGSNVPRVTPRREGSMRPHLNTRRSTRQDSFHSELEPIVSSGDEDAENAGNTENAEEEENEATQSPSGSFDEDSADDSMRRLRLARTRESCDDRFSGYLLALAAKAAEKQLREQALAAFPNESIHEVVEHFYDREVEGGSEDDDVITAVGQLPQGENSDDDGDGISVVHIERRPTEVGWALKEMQQHQENLQKMRDDEEKKQAEATKQPPFNDPFWTNGMTNKIASAATGAGEQDRQKKFELEKMQKAASPPMLGADLVFRMCQSPKSTKLETDQLHNVLPNRSENGGGLWGGYCVANETQQYLSPAPKGPTMIQTPNVERDDPFASAFASEVPGSEKTSPLTSPTTANFNRRQEKGKGIQLIPGIESRLKAEVKKSKLEEEIEREFDDKFVTQVYNYLSLGYPALAWAYDSELSRISKVELEELRANDRSRDIKGYMGTPEAAGAKGHCARWNALKVYIHEWARQHPSMAEGGAAMWGAGVRERRGSWAI